MQPHLTMADLLKTHVEVQNKFNNDLDVNTLRAKNRRLRKAVPLNAAGKRISKTTQAKAELPPKKSLFKGAADKIALNKAIETAPAPLNNSPFVAKKAPKRAKAGASPNP